MEYVKADSISLRGHPEFREKWVQNIISEDPSVIGLGDLVLKDSERRQPHAGRLDLLLQDPESDHRYEVELQLGRTDESHIIRTIEYWDIERKRYPQYEHTAVIVAEDITSRFLNVISLFNGAIPLIAIQMNAIRVGEQASLVFTKVLDQTILGLVEEDEEITEVTDRAYWEKRSSATAMKTVDEIISIIQAIDPQIEPKYNRPYIGLAKSGISNNFVHFVPRKKHVVISVRLSRSDQIESALEDSDLDFIDYHARSGRFRVRVRAGDAAEHKELLEQLMTEAEAESRG